MTRSTRTTALIAAIVLALVFAAIVGGLGDPTSTGLGQLGAWLAGLLS